MGAVVNLQRRRSVDPEPDDQPDPKTIANLIGKLQAAGHDVRQDRSGGYLVTKWGMTRHCIDAESLQAFGKQLGMTP